MARLNGLSVTVNTDWFLRARRSELERFLIDTLRKFVMRELDYVERELHS